MTESPSKDAAAAQDRERRANAFPETQLPLWLLRRSISAARQAIRSLQPTDYRLLSRFASDMRTWYCAAPDMAKGLEMCVKSIRTTAVGKRWRGAAEKIRNGSTLTGALRGANELLPAFFLPVIEAGEKAGRLDDALEFISTHCKMLAGPAAAIRNVWLYPLAIMLLGSILKVLIPLVLGSVGVAAMMLGSEAFSWFKLAVIVTVVIATPARYFFEQVCLRLPLIGELQREIAMHRFFRTLALVYCVGGHRVEVMIRTAAKAVSNTAVRADLLKAAEAIEADKSITDAFRMVSEISKDEKATIEVGDISGTLEKSFEQIADSNAASMQPKLEMIQYIASRLVMFSVVSALIGTILSVVLATQLG